MNRRLIWIIAAVVVVAAVVTGVILYRQNQASQNTAYQTLTITRGDLTALVGATGTVRANQTTLLSWQTTGRIQSLDVQVGDMVKKGDVLAQLDPASLPQNIILARADLINAQRALEDLRNSDVSRAQAQLALTQAQKSLEDALENRTNKDYQRASQSTLDQARANYIVAQNQMEKAEENYNVVADRPEDDPVRAALLSQLAAARQSRDRALANLNYLLSAPDEQELAEADARVEVARANLKDAERNWERVKDGPNAQDIAAAEARVEAIQAALELDSLSAPFAGTISAVNSKPGDQVTPGLSSFRLDDLATLLVDVEIPEVDINRVQLGQPAKLSFDAIQNKEYNGTITEVGRVGNPSVSGVNFTVTIALTDPDESVRPGMTAAVNIVVSQLKDVLLVPNRAVRLRDGQRVVYVLRGAETEPRMVEIEIGATSDVNSEIISGDVLENDLVVLNPPVEFQPGRPPFAQ